MCHPRDPLSGFKSTSALRKKRWGEKRERDLKLASSSESREIGTMLLLHFNLDIFLLVPLTDKKRGNLFVVLVLQLRWYDSTVHYSINSLKHHPDRDDFCTKKLSFVRRSVGHNSTVCYARLLYFLKVLFSDNIRSYCSCFLYPWSVRTQILNTGVSEMGGLNDRDRYVCIRRLVTEVAISALAAKKVKRTPTLVTRTSTSYC